MDGPNHLIEIAKKALERMPRLPEYTHRNSPRIFTMPQLVGLLEIGRHLRIPSCRRLAKRLKDLPEVLTALGIEKVPNYGTLWRANHWLKEHRSQYELTERRPEVVPQVHRRAVGRFGSARPGEPRLRSAVILARGRAAALKSDVRIPVPSRDDALRIDGVRYVVLMVKQHRRPMQVYVQPDAGGGPVKFEV